MFCCIRHPGAYLVALSQDLTRIINQRNETEAATKATQKRGQLAVVRVGQLARKAVSSLLLEIAHALAPDSMLEPWIVCYVRYLGGGFMLCLSLARLADCCVRRCACQRPGSPILRVRSKSVALACLSTP